MRRRLQYIMVIFVLLLTACVRGETKQEHSDENDSLTVVEEEQEQQEQEQQEQEKQEDKSEEQSQKVVTEQEVLYQMDAIWGFKPIDDANSKVVLLTIDDAPDKHALQMAKTLKKLDAPAIFFVNGHFLQTEEQKATLKEIHEMGFAIGNHTNTHPNLQKLSEKEQKEEILAVSEIVEKVIGERPKYFRAPFGQNTAYSKSVVEEDGMLLMNWSFGYDWEKKYMNAEALTDIMVNTEYMRDGANLLMHDREWTAAALEDIVKGLREKGYGFIEPETIQGVE